MMAPALTATRRDDVTLGILAGGRGSRLGGVEKAWLQRSGMSQIERCVQRLAPEVGAVLVSANRSLPRYAALGLDTVTDQMPDLGPLGGLQALAAHCRTPWLLTLPVDLYSFNDCLLRSLAAAGPDGAFAVDDDGAQPLVALWPVAEMRQRIDAALASGRLAVHALQSTLGMAPCRLQGVRFGNLNTPQDLTDAGFDPV